MVTLNSIYRVLHGVKHCEQWLYIPYSGKFSQVQNFAESPLRAPEEIFTVLIFALPACTGKQGAIDIYSASTIFVVFIFVKADLSAKIAKFFTTRKFPAIQYAMQGRKTNAVYPYIAIGAVYW